MKKELKGSIALVFLALLYSLYGIFSRVISDTFDAFSQNLVVSLMGCIVFGFIFLFTGKKIKSIVKKDLFWVLAWLLSGSVVMPLEFIIFNHLKIGLFYFLSYSTIIVGGFLFGKLFFKEKMNFVKMVAVILSLIGLFLIYFISIGGSEIIYVFYSLICGLIIGFWNTVSKKFSNNYSNSQLIFFLCLISATVAGIGMFFTGEKMPVFNFSFGWIMIVIYGFIQMTTVNLIIYAFKNLDAQVASVMMPVEIVFAVFFGFLIFRETIPFMTLIGGILIVSAAVLPNVVMLMKNRK